MHLWQQHQLGCVARVCNPALGAQGDRIQSLRHPAHDMTLSLIYHTWNSNLTVSCLGEASNMRLQLAED